MTFKQQVIDAAVKGLIEGGYSDVNANLLRTLLELVYQSGYNEACRNFDEN